MNMIRRTKYCRVKIAYTIVYHTLVVYYHAHCSIPFLTCCPDMGGIVISCDSEVKNVKQCPEEGGRWDGKRSGVTGKGE